MALSSTPDADQQLRQVLIGTWDSDFSRRSFHADGTFSDTSVMAVGFGTTTLDTLTLATWGTYEVKDSVVDYSTVHLSWQTSSGNPWSHVSFSLPAHLVSITGDTLYMTPTDIFPQVNAIVSTQALDGNWRFLTNQVVLGATGFPPAFLCRMEYLYAFDRDSMTCERIVRWLDMPQARADTARGTYTYNAPYLKISTDLYDRMRVAFRGTKMYWHHLDWTATYARAK